MAHQCESVLAAVLCEINHEFSKIKAQFADTGARLDALERDQEAIIEVLQNRMAIRRMVFGKLDRRLLELERKVGGLIGDK